MPKVTPEIDITQDTLRKINKLMQVNVRYIAFLAPIALFNILWGWAIDNVFSIVIGALCVLPILLLSADIYRWRKMERSFLHNNDTISHLAKTKPILMATFNYAYDHYDEECAATLLRMPKIVGFVNEVEFKKSRTATPAEAEQLVKDLADAAGMKEVES